MKINLSEDEIEVEGFVTVMHDFDILKKMNKACAHSIAKDGNKVAGYALAMTRDFRDEIKSQYDYLVTEVATTNKRSLKARKKVGFKVKQTQISDGTSWELVLWD
jgi:hypothetical protein